MFLAWKVSRQGHQGRVSRTTTSVCIQRVPSPTGSCACTQAEVVGCIVEYYTMSGETVQPASFPWDTLSQPSLSPLSLQQLPAFWTLDLLWIAAPSGQEADVTASTINNSSTGEIIHEKTCLGLAVFRTGYVCARWLPRPRGQPWMENLLCV